MLAKASVDEMRADVPRDISLPEFDASENPELAEFVRYLRETWKLNYEEFHEQVRTGLIDSEGVECLQAMQAMLAYVGTPAKQQEFTRALALLSDLHKEEGDLPVIVMLGPDEELYDFFLRGKNMSMTNRVRTALGI